jgi:hypothetical protein
MAACAYCGTTILFGGVREGHLRFCNQRCHQAGQMLRMCDDLPQEMVDEALLDVHGGQCPRCKRAGPIDVHIGYRVYSLVVMTTWTSPQIIGCRSCGVKHQLGSVLISTICGWWGFPWGLIGTPVQIVRNLVAIAKPPDPSLPSTRLEKIVRMQIGAAMMMQAQQSAPPTAPQRAEQARASARA